MYNRLNGLPFTVNNPSEKKEIIEFINSKKKNSDEVTCVGLDVEQFTGKINYAIMQMGKKYLKYRVSGVFPNMRLDHESSNVVYDVVFPVSENQKEVIIEKPSESLIEDPKIAEKRIIESEIKVDDPKVSNIQMDELENKQIIDERVETTESLNSDSDMNRTESEVKQRGRKKK